MNFLKVEIINDKLIPLYHILTEDFVGNNNLYVLELKDKQNVLTKDSSIDERMSRLVIEKMKIKDLKETWAGRSEVAFQGFKLSRIRNAFYECGEYITGSVNCYNYRGKRITRLKRRHRNKTKTYNFNIKGSNNYGNDFFTTLFSKKIFSLLLPKKFNLDKLVMEV